MSYSETLSRIIAKTGLSLREITDTCYRQSKLRIDASYISKLQTGKQSPASEDVNIALAKACDADPDELVYQAYLEKAPNMIRDILNGMVSMGRKMWTNAMDNDFRPTPEIALPEYKIIKAFISNMDEFADTAFEDAMEAENEELKFLFGTVPVTDEGMAPTIPKHADVTLDGKDSIDLGDIVYVYFKNGDEAIVRRYFPVGDQIHLIPDNKRYSPTIVNEIDVTILKVISYTIRV